jgi:hypothetical protein
VGSAAAVAQLERPHISFMQSRRHFFTRPGFIFAVALMLRLATAAIFLHQPDIYRGGAQMTIDSAGMLTEGYEAVGGRAVTREREWVCCSLARCWADGMAHPRHARDARGGYASFRPSQPRDFDRVCHLQ